MEEVAKAAHHVSSLSKVCCVLTYHHLALVDAVEVVVYQKILNLQALECFLAVAWEEVEEVLGRSGQLGLMAAAVAALVSSLQPAVLSQIRVVKCPTTPLRLNGPGLESNL